MTTTHHYPVDIQTILRTEGSSVGISLAQWILQMEAKVNLLEVLLKNQEYELAWLRSQVISQVSMPNGYSQSTVEKVKKPGRKIEL